MDKTIKNGKRKKREMTLHEKAVRLCEGGVVECMGHYVKAQVYGKDDLPCIDCKMDSICQDEMCDLCAECDGLTNKEHILILACDQTDNVQMQ